MIDAHVKRKTNDSALGSITNCGTKGRQFTDEYAAYDVEFI